MSTAVGVFVPSITIPTYEDLLCSLPEKYQTEEVKKLLMQAYERELSVILDHIKQLIKQGTPFIAKMMIFVMRDDECQAIADFSVSDLSKPVDRKYNWHLQENSRWVYSGAILFDTRAFESGNKPITTHH